MAVQNKLRTEVNDRLFGADLSRAVSGVIGQISAWNEARVTRNALSKLSDHELDDIGITRSEIYNIR